MVLTIGLEVHNPVIDIKKWFAISRNNFVSHSQRKVIFESFTLFHFFLKFCQIFPQFHILFEYVHKLAICDESHVLLFA